MANLTSKKQREIELQNIQRGKIEEESKDKENTLRCSFFFSRQMQERVSTEGRFTAWTMKSDHGRWSFDMVQLDGLTSMV